MAAAAAAAGAGGVPVRPCLRWRLAVLLCRRLRRRPQGRRRPAAMPCPSPRKASRRCWWSCGSRRCWMPRAWKSSSRPSWTSTAARSATWSWRPSGSGRRRKSASPSIYWTPTAPCGRRWEPGLAPTPRGSKGPTGRSIWIRRPGQCTTSTPGPAGASGSARRSWTSRRSWTARCRARCSSATSAWTSSRATRCSASTATCTARYACKSTCTTTAAPVRCVAWRSPKTPSAVSWRSMSGTASSAYSASAAPRPASKKRRRRRTLLLTGTGSVSPASTPRCGISAGSTGRSCSGDLPRHGARRRGKSPPGESSRRSSSAKRTRCGRESGNYLSHSSHSSHSSRYPRRPVPVDQR